MFYVYAYFEPEETIPFYIGKGCGERLFSHLQERNLQKNTRFYCKLRSMIRKGIYPRIIKLEQNLSDSDAIRLEIALIAKFKRIKDGGSLCNESLGGDGTCGYHHTEATKKILSSRQKGNSHTDPRRQPIGAFMFGKLIRRYSSIYDTRKDGFSYANIAKILDHKTRQAYGYEWKRL